MWLGVAALVLGGCTDLCPGDRSSGVTFAEMASYRDQITACIRKNDCDRLCTDAVHVDGEIESCVITSVVGQDSSLQTGPIAPSIDLQSLRGVNVLATYVKQVTCDQGVDIAGNDGSTDGGSTDDGSTDTGSDDGSCDDGSCGDGSGSDGSGGDGSGSDGSGSDGSGDDGGGDDGGGDDGGGNIAPAPTPGSSVGRTPAAASATRHAQRGVGHS